MEEQLYCDAHRKMKADSSIVSGGGGGDGGMDLFDLIARTQNSRINDQRCELPGVIQVSVP